MCPVPQTKPSHRLIFPVMPKTDPMNESPQRSHARFTKLAWVGSLSAIVIAVSSYYAFVMVPEREQLMRKYELRNAGLNFHEFYDVNSRPPASLNEFMNYEPEGLYAGNQTRDLSGFADRVRKGEIIVLWNSTFFDSGWENDQHLLAYESQTPNVGGLVLMLSGSVKLVTAEKFATLPQAPTSKLGGNDPLDNTSSSKNLKPKSTASGSTLIILAIENGSLKPKSKANVTAEELEEHLKSIDWNQRPLTQLSLSHGGFENLNILAEHTAPDDPIIVWSSVKSGVPKKMKFGPIQPNGVDTMKIFLSYLAQDGKYKTMVEWREEIDIGKDNDNQ